MLLKSRKDKLAVLILSLLFVGAVLIFSACADTGDEEVLPQEEAPIPPDQVATVGFNVCTNCHFCQVTQWMTGQHANFESWNEMAFQKIDLGMMNTGFPYYSFDEWEADPAYCARCHDQLGDGYRLTAEWTGNVPRPVVGCESCHGGGANHYGIGAIPYPKPDYNRCGQCHNSQFPEGHLPYHPTGADIYEEFSESPHLSSINSHVYEDGGGVRARCSRCHTDEGFKKYIDEVPGTTGYDDIVAFFTNKAALTEVTPVQCYTCHEPHIVTADELERLPESTVNGNSQSRQFNTCTACHQLIDDTGIVLTDAYHDPAVNPYGDLEEVITDNHAAVPGDTRQNTGANGIPLYYVRKGDDNSCAACHNPHSADTTINEQYARSGHGDTMADPWIHYNWKLDTRKPCQRCHTSTGAKNYLSNPAAYTPSNNNFSYLIEGAGDGPGQDNGQLESLYCWACHTNFKGGLRNPGAITALYVDMGGNPVVFPDVAGSNICLACHTGRESGGSIQNSAADFQNTSFINSHYLTGGAILFKAGGYEYAGSDYTNVSYFHHDQIGTSVYPDTGSNGPCVGCHMKTAESHLFQPVEEDEVTGQHLAITSTSCAVCHTPGSQYEMTVAELEEEEELFEASLEALKEQLALHGYHFYPAYPYFYTAEYDPTYNEATANPHCQKNLPVKNWQTGGTSTFTWNGTTCVSAADQPGTAGTGKPNMGAAFNFNLLEHDPGAFVHNRFYTKRLIYDSIDWLDDNSLNGSTRNTLCALDPVAHPYRDDAITYLLNPAGDCDAGGRP